MTGSKLREAGFLTVEEYTDIQSMIEYDWAGEPIDNRDDVKSFKKETDRMALKEIISEKLRDKKWTFGEIADVTNTVDELAEYAYDKMTPKEKLDFIWDKAVHGIAEQGRDDANLFARLFTQTLTVHLKQEIRIIIKNELSDATVIFKEDNKNEVSERSMGGESHKKRSADEKTDSEE